MSAARVVMRSMWRKASGKYALIVLGLWVLVSLISLVWTPYALLETDGFHAWASPTAAHPLGTDGVGADVLSWLMAGSRTNLAIASLTVVVAGIFGLALVTAMVSRHTALRSTSVVVVDALISIPTVLIALMLSVPFGASAAVIVAACGFAYGLNLARIVRPDLSWRRRGCRRTQLGAFPRHIRTIHQHLPADRAMAGTDRHDDGDRAASVRRRTARRHRPVDQS